MGDQRSSRRGRPDYHSRGGIRNSLRNLPRNSRFWEKLQDHGDRRSHRRGRQDKANLSRRGLGGRNAATFWRHLTSAAEGLNGAAGAALGYVVDGANHGDIGALGGPVGA